MKALPTRFRDYLWRLAIIVVCYFVLYEIMARTGMIERVMTFNFQWWELVLIALFLVSRLITYLFIVPTLLALAAYHGTWEMLNAKSRSISPR